MPFRWILKVLVKASPKWKNLAVALCLHMDQIESIQEDDNILKLMKVLQIWLSGESATLLSHML